MSETFAQFEVMEDEPRMSPTNTPSSPDSSNCLHNDHVTEELEVGNINASVDEDDGTMIATQLGSVSADRAWYQTNARASYHD